jgi:pimeloyl-ACP methyl ester carboxylesterase
MAQLPPANVFRTDFNSSFKLTSSQIRESQLDEEMVENLQNIFNYEASQRAFGGPSEDDFYTLPPLKKPSRTLSPGQVLKVQAVTDSNEFSTPPGTVLSRIMYTTTDFNGTVIPATGFILWPYLPKKVGKRSSEKASVVIWTHGTSGFFGPSAPSAHRGLWYENDGPFLLARQGYAVFAPDYAGLGVRHSWDGSEILHQYQVHTATAYDTLYGFNAVLAAFHEKIENNYVVIGHSQGGSAAWAVAETLALQKNKFKNVSAGYRGAIPVSPGTNLTQTPTGFIFPVVATGLKSVFPSFKLEDWLTPLGVARVSLSKDVGAGVGFIQRLVLSSNELVREDYDKSWYAVAFAKLIDLGGKDFKGPVLVIQGTTDPYVAYNGTIEAVEKTWETFPHHDLELLEVNEVGHVPALSATQHYWLQWIQDRLEEKPLEKKGPVKTTLKSFLPSEQYKRTINSYVQWAGLSEYSYQVILPV